MAETAGTATATAMPEGHGWEVSGAAREIRLGLVVYGGVSLAIYINGVAHELFRAQRGRGVYKLLKRLLDSHIVVDIISGTSAGGINGLLLAYALTNEREFGECASLWREHGSISRLLRLIDDQTNTASLLDSKNYYIPRLEAAFRSMRAIGPEEKRKERASICPELDLFVTGTSFDGEMSTAFDATGRRIDIKTHRTVFHLKHRAGRKPEFEVPAEARQRKDYHEARLSALARLAAITSCFPAAFEPVKVTPHVSGHERMVFNELQKWGRLNTDTETWFLDGGVLDNKPFSYTIQEIFNRTAERPVERKLFYVEPDPERFLTTRGARTAAPNVIEAATQALFGIPGYESIADDLEQIVKQNDRLARLAKARENAEKAVDSLKALSVSEIPSSIQAIYRHTRLAQLSDRAIKGLLEGQGFKLPLNQARTPEDDEDRAKHEARHQTASTLAKAFADWEGSGDDTLDRYDVYIRRRRVLYVIYKVFAAVSTLCEQPDRASDDASMAKSLRETWKKLNEQLSAYDIVLWALEKTLDDHPLPESVSEGNQLAAAGEWHQLEAKFDRVLAMDVELEADCQADWFSADARTRLHTRFKAMWEQAGGNDATASASARAADGSPNLLQRIEAQTHRIVAAHSELEAAWNGFIWHDAHFFPIDYYGDLAEKDEIDVVRVSPIDADRAFSERRFEDKITGETVMHFGAFLKKSWRSNDIMWGRLDGVCRIFDALVTAKALERAVKHRDVRQLLSDDLHGELAPDKLFPNAGVAIQRTLAHWLSDLTSDDARIRDRAIADETKRDLLLWCAQFEILNEELPIVLGDAATEELEWNNVRTSSGFVRTDVRADRSLAYIKGTEYTKNFLDDLQAKQKGSGEFSDITKAPVADYFLNNYKIGGETASDDIPPAVLAETITAAALVARNCLVNAFPKQGAAMKSNLLFKLLVDWPLRVAHTFAVFARRERSVYLAGLTALFTYALLALFSVVVLDVNLRSGNSNARIVGLVALPLFILIVVGYMAWIWAMRHSGRSWLARLATVALALITLLAATPIVGAFVVTWPALNAKLKDWMIGVLQYPSIAEHLPAGPYAWLLAQVKEGWLTIYPLATLAILFIVVVPMLRGFVQSRMARRLGGVSVFDSTRDAAGMVNERMRRWRGSASPAVVNAAASAAPAEPPAADRTR